MNRRDRRELARYVRHIADAMGLRDWEISLNWEDPAEEGEGGSIDWPEGRKIASIRLSENFRDYEPAEQRQIVVHELTHCHFAQMQDTVEEDLPVHLARPTYDLYSRSFRRAFEYGIDGVAAAIATHMPLIQWPT